MFQGKVAFVLALALGLMAGLLTWTSIRQKKAQIEEGWKLKQVLVANMDIPEGTVIKIDMIAKHDIPEKFVTESVVTPDNKHFIIDQKVMVPLKAGDPILWGHIQSSQGYERLSNIIHESFRAISIKVNRESSVSQYVRPNDHIDIITTFRDPESKELISSTLLQNVIVLNTGKITGMTNINLLNSEDRNYVTVSVLVLPEEAEMLVLAQEIGNLYLSLRNSEDIEVQEQKGKVNVRTLLTGERVKSLEKKRIQRIEVIRGQGSNPRGF